MANSDLDQYRAFHVDRENQRVHHSRHQDGHTHTA
jgi:hypothetical protein